MTYFLADNILNIQSILEKGYIFLRKDRENQFIIVLQSIHKVRFGHDRILHLSAEKSLFEKVVELDLIKFTDYENIDDVIGFEIRNLSETIGNSDETQSPLSLKEGLEWFDRVIRFYKNLRKLVTHRTISVDIIKLLLVLFARLEYAKIFKIYKFTSDTIDLFIYISA